MDLGLQGQVVAVTGAGSGIGAAIARLFLALGAEVHAADRSAEGLAALGRQAGLRTSTVALTDRRAAAAWIEDVEAAAGRPVEVLVNNAGGSLGQTPQPLEEVSDAAWDAI